MFKPYSVHTYRIQFKEFGFDLINVKCMCVFKAEVTEIIVMQYLKKIKHDCVKTDWNRIRTLKYGRNQEKIILDIK